MGMEIHHVHPDAEGAYTWPSFLPEGKRSIITIGTFDGVHLGHQSVINRTVELAKSTEAASIVILFDPRPALVHQWAAEHDGEQIPEEVAVQDEETISSVDQRLGWLEDLGIDHAIVVHYTIAFGQQTYMYFLGQLTGKLGMRTLVLGADATIGKNNSGNVTSIDRLAQATRLFDLSVVDDRGPGFTHIPSGVLDGVEVSRQVRIWSSSNVRYLLDQGDIAGANAILGRPHVMEGEVVHGEKFGRTLGFPTANLGGVVEGFMPQDGVYSGWLIDTDESGAEVARYASAISVGTKPTLEDEIGKQKRLLEAFAITDDWIKLYGHRIRVEFVSHLRGQVKFDSVDDMVVQMKKDVAAAVTACGVEE